jgi:glycosyltransferase involved in cell wall biosynthesis
MRANVEIADADQDNDAQVSAEDDRAEAPALSVIGVDPERGFGGGETQVLGLTLALKRGGHRAELICDRAGPLWERAVSSSVKCHPLRIRNAVDLAAGLKLRAILKREHFDIVHFHTSRAHSMAPCARGLGSAMIVTRRMDYTPNRLFAPYLYNRAVDGVIAISGGVADSLARAGVDQDRVTVVGSGVDCECFRPPSTEERAAARAALKVTERDFVVSAVGALEQRKGHRFLIAAIGSLAATGKYRCFIAGQGLIHSVLQGEIAVLRCTDRIKLLGRVDDARKLLWASDAFAMPSLKEGLGVAALEAMATALPVIASDVGGLSELVENGSSGILVPPGNPQEIASALERLSSSSELRSRMGAAARARVVEHYSIANMAARTLAVYRACVEKIGIRRGRVE